MSEKLDGAGEENAENIDCPLFPSLLWSIDDSVAEVFRKMSVEALGDDEVNKLKLLG